MNLSYTPTLSGIHQEVKGSKLKGGVTEESWERYPMQHRAFAPNASLPVFIREGKDMRAERNPLEAI